MRTLFKVFRVIILLTVFAALAFYTKTQKLKSRSWSEPLQLVIYPINAEDSPVVEDYIKQLDSTIFDEIDQFFEDEVKHYSLSIEQPTITRLGKIISVQPPTSPAPGSSFLKIIGWSLKFRYWAYRNTPDDESNLHRVRVFLLYHEAAEDKYLQHSLGLDKGLLVIAHVFASPYQEQQNNIIIAHELLHTVGASDKYNIANQPVFPDGYAEPDNTPLYPQILAEIMSAKIPVSASQSKMAESLKQCIIGEKTAREINWIQEKHEN